MRRASKLNRFLPASLLKTMRAHQTEAERLCAIWPTIVGQELAAHSAPAGYQDNVLTVFVENAIWASKLRHNLPEVTAQCRLQKNLELELLKTIKIKIGFQAAGKTGARDTMQRDSKIPKTSARIILESAKGIKDEELRASLERLGSAPGFREPGPKKPEPQKNNKKN